jgi:hypothetical protein
MCACWCPAIGASQNKKLKVGALIIDPSTAGPWIFGLLALVLGGWWLKRESGSFSKVWNSTLDQIKLDATNRGGAAGTGTAGTGAAGTTGAAR